MAATDTHARPPEPVATQPTLGVPDYLASPNAVFSDEGAEWRYGKAPDYSKTRKAWEEGKKMNHAAGSLPQLVENLVKNWEVEASFKSRLRDWRTIDHANYGFAINGGPMQSAEHMIKVGTYNGIITPNEYYSPEHSDFASSHKTFKRMMPTFAWEVIEVFSGPPTVAFKWRHWGTMKDDYVGFNNKGEKIVAKAHGGSIEVYGVTVATVDDKVRLQKIDTWFDPLEMFRQIAPHGIVNRVVMNGSTDPETELDLAPTHEPPQHDGVKIAEEHNYIDDNGHNKEPAPEEILAKHISGTTGKPADAFVPHQGADTQRAAETSQPMTCPFAPPAEAVQSVVEYAATHGADMDIDQPTSNFHEAVGHVTDKQSSSSTEVPQPVEARQEGQQTAPKTMQSPHGVAEKAGRSVPGARTYVPPSSDSYASTGDVENVLTASSSSNCVDESTATGTSTKDAMDQHVESSSGRAHPHPHDTEQSLQPAAGEAIAVPAQSEETRMTCEEMSAIQPGEAPSLMNRE